MIPKLNIHIILGLVLVIITWLFVGLFRDVEFHEPDLFTKYRPTLKVYFYSPIGESDLQLKDLSLDKQSDESAFQEFVINQHQQYNSYAKLWYLPMLLIQLALTFLTLGIYKFKHVSNYKIWQLPVHFLINIITTSLGLGFILVLDKLFITWLIILIVLIINYLTIWLLTKQTIKLSS